MSLDRVAVLLVACAALTAASSVEAQSRAFEPLDVFQLEYASDVRISPDGARVVYRRNGMSLMRDRREGRLWMIGADGSNHRPLTSEERAESSPVWSPDGSRLAFVASGPDGSEIFVHWLESGETARITQLERSPRDLAWSPDGSRLAFVMRVPEDPPRLATMPEPPEGAEWADEPRVETRVRHEADGSGYLEPGFDHVFVVPADGGMPRQVTSGAFDHTQPAWTGDGRALVVVSDREPDWEYRTRESELYRVALEGGAVTRLTERPGPDTGPMVSPDGSTIAYLGFDDRVRTYQVTDLYLMAAHGSDRRLLTADLDRSVGSPVWAADGSGIYVSYVDEGVTRVARIGLDGSVREVASGVGGTAVGRPYGGGNFSVARDGTLAFTLTASDEPSEVALVERPGEMRVITRLNDDLEEARTFSAAEMFWTESSHDGRPIQSWIVHPPDFDPERTYPLILEIHGGPISNYGDRFSAEVQLYAAAGYVVLYSNPRGSTGYGEAFGDLLYHDYPGNDYDDLMSAVDAVVERGYVDESRLYVTGGSAGGIMTAWIVGMTDRFRAAVVTKPVVNWISKTLVADNYNGYADYRYPGQPWENPETYWEFSPISLVAEVETPTMVMVGTADLRTPLSEAKQLYHALRLRRVETALVEIPGAYHDIANRPSQLIAKVLNTLAWFERYP